MNDHEISEVLKALAHRSRLEILAGLIRNECSVGEIQKKLGLPQSTISQHLRILKSHGIIRSRQEGTKRCYRVVDSRVKRIMRIVREQ